MKFWSQWILIWMAGACFIWPGLAWGQAAIQPPKLSAIPLEDASAPSLEEVMDHRWELEAAYQALYSGLPIADELFAELAALPEWDAQQRTELLLAQVTALVGEGKIEAADTVLQGLQGRQLEGALATSFSLRSGLVSYLLYEEERAREFLSTIASEDLNPYDLGWFYTLSGLLAERAGRFMEAASFFDQARSTAASPFQRQVAESLIQRNLLLRGQFSESLIRDLERLLEENRNSRLAVQYAQELAISLARSNRVEEALRVLEDQIAFTLPENEDQLDQLHLLSALIERERGRTGRNHLEWLLRLGENRNFQQVAIRYLLMDAASNEEMAFLLRFFQNLLTTQPDHPLRQTSSLPRLFYLRRSEAERKPASN